MSRHVLADLMGAARLPSSDDPECPMRGCVQETLVMFSLEGGYGDEAVRCNRCAAAWRVRIDGAEWRATAAILSDEDLDGGAQ